MSRLRRILLVAASTLVVGASAAAAAFVAQAQATQTVATATLAPPTGLASIRTSATSGQVNLSWVPSSGAVANAQQVLAAASEAGPYSVISSLGAASTTFSDTTAAYNGERYYKIRATRAAWLADSPVRSSHSRPMSSGINRVSGAGAGTALTGPWTTAGTNLAALATTDATRYQPTAWPAAPANMYGASYIDATHAWTSGTATVQAFDGTNWINQTPGVTTSLDQILFVDTQNGWAVGSTGTIIHTTNGGTTWTSQTSGVNRNLREIDCATTTFCVAVGSSDTVLVTTNGGATWTDRSPGNTSAMWDVDCTSTTTCWVVGAGGIIRKTIDGGTTWTTQTSGVTSTLRGVSCLSDGLSCWAVGTSGVIRRTTNGGTTWTGSTLATTQTLTSIQMVTSSIGYLTGTGSIVWKTTDGGANWTAQTAPAAGYLSVSCFSVNDCITVSDLGTALITHDGGAHWGEQASRYVQLSPLTPTLASTGTATSVKASFNYRTTTVPGTGTRFLLVASNDNGVNWSTYDLPAPTAASTDVAATVDITNLGFSNPASAQQVLLRFVAVPQTSTLTVQLDLAHLNIN